MGSVYQPFAIRPLVARSASKGTTHPLLALRAPLAERRPVIHWTTRGVRSTFEQPGCEHGSAVTPSAAGTRRTTSRPMNWLREPDAEPISGYRLVCPLGTGGFGEVWKCVAPGNIFKAIKFVYGNLNSLDGDAYRAEQEFKALEKIKEVRHPFILSTERIDIVEGDLAIVMELADRSLHDLLQDHQAAGR